MATECRTLQTAKDGPWRGHLNLGIDFHQFRYPMLRREFNKLGFSKIYDRVDMANTNHVSAKWKKWVVSASQQNGLVKWLSLTFADATRFVCVK